MDNIFKFKFKNSSSSSSEEMNANRLAEECKTKLTEKQEVKQRLNMLSLLSLNNHMKEILIQSLLDIPQQPMLEH